VADFDLPALIDLLRTERSQAEVVMVEAVEDDADRPFDSYHLDLDPPLSQQFRENLARTVARWPGREEWSDYVAGWVPEENEFAIADQRVAAGPLLDAIRAGRLPDRVRLPGLPDAAEPRPRGYAVVVSDPTVGDDDETAFLIRRRDPLEHLDRGRITALWSETKLTRAEGVVGFDSGVDVVIWRRTVLIRSLAAFEALFFPPAIRADAAEAVVRSLDERIKVRNVDVLVATARRDSIFAGRLRRLGTSEVFSEASLPRIRASLKRFGIERRFIRGDTLEFIEAHRWRYLFLAALEDALTVSPGSGRHVVATSQRTWDRRAVTGVMIEDDHVVTLCGNGWTATASEATSAIESGRSTFFVRQGEDELEVLPDDGQDDRRLVAEDAGGRDVLAELPHCEP
jgi:hypothetical protein